MALKIRLARHGRRKKPFYWIVVANSESPRDGKFLEKVGVYAPLLPHGSNERVIIDRTKMEEWIAKGAKLTERVAKLANLAG